MKWLIIILSMPFIGIIELLKRGFILLFSIIIMTYYVGRYGINDASFKLNKKIKEYKKRIDNHEDN